MYRERERKRGAERGSIRGPQKKREGAEDLQSVLTTLGVKVQHRSGKKVREKVLGLSEDTTHQRKDKRGAVGEEPHVVVFLEVD